LQGGLILEDGRVFSGRLIGAPEEAAGEVVFCTSMTGYLEILTDQSYAGQLVVLTYPLIGNYGVDPAFAQAERPRAKALIVREAAQHPSHPRSRGTIAEYLAEHDLPGLVGVDTRALTRHLRTRGTMRGYLFRGESPPAGAVEMARAADLTNLAERVTTDRIESYGENGPLIAVIDYGRKENMLRELLGRGARVRVYPARTEAERILADGPDGILLTNGPGDPADLTWEAAQVRRLVEKKPVFGICLGHQVAALALGGRTYKLKFGHRGANHPVQEKATGRVVITSQNHGYAVAAEGLEEIGFTVTHWNLNDGTVEGLRHRELPLWTVQYHPEASPGPWDAREAFEEFLKRVGGGRDA